MFTLLEGLQLLVGQPQLLLLQLQGAVVPAQLHLLHGLDFELLLQLHHLVHQELGQTLMTLLHCGDAEFNTYISMAPRADLDQLKPPALTNRSADEQLFSSLPLWFDAT